MRRNIFIAKILVLIVILLSCTFCGQVESSKIYYNYGCVYAKQGNFTKAISYFTKAIQINPNLAQSYCNRGAAYEEQGNLSHAISDYAKAIEIKPDFPEAYFNRGVVYVKQGNLLKAILDYTKAIEMDTGSISSYFCLFCVHIFCSKLYIRECRETIFMYS